MSRRKLTNERMGISNVKINKSPGSHVNTTPVKTETIPMKDIVGLAPVKKRGKFDCRSAYSFLSGVVGEYVLGLPEKGASAVDYSFWSPFKGEGETDKWFKSLDRFDSLKTLLDQIDFSGDGKSFESLSSRITFRIEGDKTTISVGDFTFGLSGSILKLQRSGDKIVCLIFSKATGNPKMSPVGRIDDLPVEAIDVPDIIPINQPSDSDRNGSLMSVDDFFASTENLRNVDNDQRMVISADTDKDLLVVAGAGSGKTRSLVGRVCYLNVVKGIPLERIQVLTYMRKATFPVIRSSTEQLGEIYSSLGIDNRGNVKVSTIDAFFKKLVDDHWSDIGFNNKPTYAFDSDDLKLNILKNIVFHEFGEYASDDRLKSIRFQLENHANGLMVNIPGIEVILRDYLDWQIENGTILDFFCVSLLLKNTFEINNDLVERICNLYDCILIDEFQDINRLQNSVFSRMYGKNVHFTFVGDDDQTIYTWRGSDNSIIRNIRKEENVRTICLTTNYRNNPHIVRAGNAILKKLEDRSKEAVEITPYEKNGSPIRITNVSWDYRDLANEIGKLYDPSPDGDKICVLCRSNKILDDVKKALADIDVPAEVVKSGSGAELSFGYMAFKSLVLIEKKVDVRANYDVLRELTGDVCSNTELRSFIFGKKQYDGSDKTITDIVKLSKHIDTTLQTIGSFEDLIISYNRGYAKDMESDSTPSRVTEDDCLQSFQEFVSENEWPYPHIDTKVLPTIFSRFERYYLGRKNIRDERAGEMNVVTISTIHSAKGLEYDSVFIINMDEKVFPNTKRIDSDYSKCLSELNNLESSRRTLDRLRSSINGKTVDEIISECTPDNLPEIGADDVLSMKGDISDDSDALLSLSADGVKEYKEIFDYYLNPVLNKIRLSINELNKQKRVIEEDYYNKEELLLSGDGDDSTEADLDSLQSDIDAKNDEIHKEEEKLREFRTRIEKLESMYRMCNRVQNLLFDVDKLNNASEIKLKLEKERREKVFEERRLFYVAMSRARKLLYLCTTSGSRPSEFIGLIPTEESESYRMTTRAEDRQKEALRRFKIATDSEMRRRKPDMRVLEEATVELKQSLPDTIRSGSEEFYKGVVEKDPIFSKLTGDAKGYFETAVFLDYLTKMGLMKFYNEILLNLQRCGEMLLRSHVTDDFESVRMSEDDSLDVQDHIYRLRNRRTKAPGQDYVKNLFSGNDRFGEKKKDFKSLAIQYYAVFSGYWKDTAEDYASNWDINSLGIDADEFIVVSCDLCNIRNEGVHDQKDEEWLNNQVPYAYECLGKMIEAL